MAQSAPSPGVSSVPDPGAIRYPVNSIMPTPALGGAAQGPAIQSPGAPSAAPGVPGGGVTRPQSTLPLNSPRGGSIPQLGGASAAPGVSNVSDPGGSRFPVNQNQTIGMPADTATPGGGDPGATGGYVPGPTVPTAQWSQFNPSANPNPGALSGGVGPAPAYQPGQTGATQQSPQANPNPGGL